MQFPNSGLLHFSATWCLYYSTWLHLQPISQYARSKRPADSVHWHAPSVPANLGRRISERMGRLTLGPYCPPHVQSVWAECHVSSALAMGFHISTWVGVISIFGCLQDVRHKLTKIVQLIIRSKRLGQPHVQSVWAECHLSSAGQWVSILVYGPVPASSGLAGAYLYWMFGFKWTKNSNCRTHLRLG